MPTSVMRVLPGPAEKFDPSRDLLEWLTSNFRQFGSIYRASIYGSEVYVLSDPDCADHILRKNWQNYPKGQAIKRVSLLLGNGLMTSEGEFWKCQRRMIQPAFHQEMVGSLTRVIVDANRVLLDKWISAAQTGVVVNVTRDVSLFVLELVLRAIFGDDYNYIAHHFDVLSSEPTRDMKFAHVFRPLKAVVKQVVTERRTRKKSTTDILAVLMAARNREDGDAMTEHQLVSEIMTLIVAGHETTASTLSWVWYLLSQHPDVEHKLSIALDQLPVDDIGVVGDVKCSYACQIIEEAMRLYPPGWLMTRRAIKDDRVGDFLIPAGTEVYISPYLIQRNPELWEHPDCFDPDRFAPDRARSRHPVSMLPFSAGPRKCIGETLARYEMEIHLVMVARQLRLRFIEGEIELEAGVNLRNKNDFIMAPIMGSTA